MGFPLFLVNVQHHILTQVKGGSETKFCVALVENLKLEMRRRKEVPECYFKY